MSNDTIDSLGLPAWLDISTLNIPAVKVLVSCVLFKTPPQECRRVTEIVLRSPTPTHLIIVDNSPEPACLDFVDDCRVTVIKSPRNLGYGRAHNLAIALSRGKSLYHLVANTDLVFESSTIPALTNFMDEHPDAGLAMPQVRYFDGRHQPTCRLLPSPFDLIAKRHRVFMSLAKHRRQKYLLELWRRDHVANLPFLTGCFMFFRRSILEGLGGFDPRYFMYGEDVDLSRRAHLMSQTLFVPQIEVFHKFRSESEPSLSGLFHLICGYARYFNKWGWLHDPERDAINRRALDSLSTRYGRRDL